MTESTDPTMRADVPARLTSGGVPEADEREALDGLYRLTSAAVFVGTDYPVTVVAWSSVLDWWNARRSQPAAPRTVSEMEVWGAYYGARLVPREPDLLAPDGENFWVERGRVFAMLAALGITVEAPRG